MKAQQELGLFQAAHPSKKENAQSMAAADGRASLDDVEQQRSLSDGPPSEDDSTYSDEVDPLLPMFSAAHLGPALATSCS